MEYVTPKFEGAAFNCPICNAFAHMEWSDLYKPQRGALAQVGMKISTCARCEKRSFWFGDGERAHMVIPRKALAPLPHADMPANVVSDYSEARNICGDSPRGAAALLRLCVQNLCIHLGGSGKNINDDIALLVKNGLPQEIQQALDIVRVVGNNSVHPGELSTQDVQDVALSLFGLLNMIVEDRIARPKKLAAMFANLPTGAQQAIAKRDSTTP